MKSKILISKDAMRADYLSCYGGHIFETKHIDRLASRGTKLNRFYTAATSSAMAYTCMFSGLNVHEINRKYFGDVKQFDQSETLFQLLEEVGYVTHVLWDKRWYASSRKRSMIFSKETIFHNLDIAQDVGPHCEYARDEDGRIIPKDNIDPVKEILFNTRKILETDNPVFLWVHLPHSLAGRTGYGSDIDLFDEIVREIMDLFDGDIYLTSDHGHMDGEKGIPCYGHHVYQGAIRIPFITNRRLPEEYCDIPISNVQLKNIVLEGKIQNTDYVYSDSRYYLQPNRKLAIIKGNYKYIYNKSDKTEELYDLEFDPNEQRNLLQEKIIDIDRLAEYFFEEVVFYPKWDDARRAYFELRNEKTRIWKQGNFWMEAARSLRESSQNGLLKTAIYFFKPKKRIKGRWNSLAKTDLRRK